MKVHLDQGIYHQFINEEGESYGSFEVFYSEADKLSAFENIAESDGWFWWPCFPGCLPESDPIGPFTTKEDAIKDAQNHA